nr:hypothetical protein [Actinomycetota bacterium]
MSFLVDPPWLFANGHAYARLAPEEAQGGIAKLAGAACLSAYWAAGVSLYLNAPYTRPLQPLLPRRDGRDFMVNWPGLRIPAKRRTRRLDAGALAMFLVVYPLALWLGWD